MTGPAVREYQSLSACLGLKAPMMISLVGAGGKTSAMLLLAGELSRKGHSVLVSTTTKIFRPELPLLLETDPSSLMAGLARRLKPGSIMAAGAGLLPSEPLPKVQGFTPQTLDAVFQAELADFILVEADGARRLPLKAPRAGEPVIPGQSGLVLGVLGLSGLGRPADEKTVLGLEEFLRLCPKKPGDRITLEDLRTLLQHPRGIFKSCPQGAERVALLNQLDLAGMHNADEVLNFMQNPAYRFIAGSLQKRTFNSMDQEK